MNICFENYQKIAIYFDGFQVSLDFDPAKEIYGVRFIFNEESENTSDNKDFRFTILLPFQFEPEQKKNMWPDESHEKETTEEAVCRYSSKQVFLKMS